MSPHRTRQAAETQRAVLEGARAAFVHLSWQKATIAVIAQMSGVSAETVYATFGNKRALLQAVIEKAVRGDQPEIPLLEQPGPQSVRNAATQREQIRSFASDICRIRGVPPRWWRSPGPQQRATTRSLPYMPGCIAGDAKISRS